MPVDVIGYTRVLGLNGKVLYKPVYQELEPIAPNTFDGPSLAIQIREGSKDGFFRKNGPHHPGRRGKERE